MVYTVQTVVQGITSQDDGLPGRVSQALELHGASDPAVVLYPGDKELGIVLQWDGDLAECVGTLLCSISTLTDSTSHIKEIHVEEEPEMPAFRASPDAPLGAALGRDGHAPVCPLYVEDRGSSGKLSLLAHDGGVA